MTENRAPRRRVLPLIALFFTGAIAFLIWRAFFATPVLPPNVIALSGRIEGDDSAVAPKTSGRILEVRFREGDSVAEGDVIAVLDDQQIHAREEAARAALKGAEAKAKAAREQINIFQEQEKQSQLQTSQSKVDAQGRVHQAEADLSAAQADLAQQEAAYQIAMFDKEAYTRLAKSGAVSERQGLQASVTADQQAATVAAAKRRVDSAQGALTSAQANLTNPDIHEAQTLTIRRQIAQQEAEISSSAAETAQAEAELAEAKANRQDLTVRAPFAGVIAVRSAEPGEVVTAGTAIVSIVDLTKVYLRGFIPGGQIGNVKLGQPARVYIDSNPKQPIDAYVSRIDPQATFTPENTYFREDRVKQVVGVKLQLKGATGYAKPGMPADGEVLTQGESWPTTKTPE